MSDDVERWRATIERLKAEQARNTARLCVLDERRPALVLARETGGAAGALDDVEQEAEHLQTRNAQIELAIAQARRELEVARGAAGDAARERRQVEVARLLDEATELAEGAERKLAGFAADLDRIVDLTERACVLAGKALSGSKRAGPAAAALNHALAHHRLDRFMPYRTNPRMILPFDQALARFFPTYGLTPPLEATVEVTS